MKIKDRIIVLSLLFLGIFVTVSMTGTAAASTIYVQNDNYYSNGVTSLNDQIQGILDKAAAGDTVVFLGKVYTNLKLVVTKKLNIISYIATELSGNSLTSPVILINGSKSSGTTITNFNIKNLGVGVLANMTSNVTLMNNNITSNNESAVTVNRSTNTSIKNNQFTDSNTGVTVYNSKNTTITKNKITKNTKGVTVKSSVKTKLNQNNISDNTENGVEIYDSVDTSTKDNNINNNRKNGFEISKSNRTIINSSTIKSNGANGVYIESSDKFKISYCNVTENYNGISTKDAINATVTNNNITGNHLHGVWLNGYARTVYITYNMLTNNGNGIRIDCTIKNLIITGNTLTGNIETETNVETGHGISFGSEYMPSVTAIIEHNIITGNQGRDICSHDSGYTSYIGSNFYGAYAWICGAVTTDTILMLIRTGEDTYVAFFMDGDTGEIESDFPKTPITFTTSNGYIISIAKENGLDSGLSPTGTTNQGYITLIVKSGERIGTLSATSWGVTTTIDLDSAFSVLPELSKCIYPDWTNSYPDDESDPGDNPGNNPGNGSGSSPNDNSGSSGLNNNPSTNPNNIPTNGTNSTLTHNKGVIVATAALENAVSSAGPGGSNDEGLAQSKSIKEIFEKNVSKIKNPQIWSLIGIVVFLVLIFGGYYKNDLVNIIKKSKK